MANIELFDQIAEQYDNDERIQVAKIIADAIRRHIGDAGGKSALDYGCGTGLVGLELAERFRSIVLADASEAMVERVRRKIETAGLRTARALCCNLESAHASTLRADYILLAQVLLHIPDVPSILARLHGLLNAGGHLLIADFNREESIVSDKVHNGFDQQELARLCRSLGYTDTASETFYHGKNIFMGKDASLFLLDAAK